MTYRVIISRSNVGQTGVYCVDPRSDSDDIAEFDSYADAGALVIWFRQRFAPTGYAVVGHSTLTPDWDAIAHEHRRGADALAAANEQEDDDDDMEDEEDDDVICDDCGEVDDTRWGHEQHRCENCDWWCGVCECPDCLIWSDSFEGSLCPTCYENYDGRSEAPGKSLRQCRVPACNSDDVHHDETTEEYLCDHLARQRLADGGIVTLAYPLPTLEVA